MATYSDQKIVTSEFEWNHKNGGQIRVDGVAAGEGEIYISHNDVKIATLKITVVNDH